MNATVCEASTQENESAHERLRRGTRHVRLRGYLKDRYCSSRLALGRTSVGQAPRRLGDSVPRLGAVPR